MSSKKYYVYKIINPITETIFYIGWTSRKSDLRFKEHIRESKTKYVNKEKSEIIQQILKNNKEPIFEVIFESTNKQESIDKEIELIDYYKRTRDGGILTNISKGGEHHQVSDEVKQKLSTLRKDKTYEELFGVDKANKIKNNISEKVSGLNNPMFNKTHSNESKKQMSLKRKGKQAHPISNYQKECIRESNRNRVWTDESKQKSSESQKERYKNNPESFNHGEWTEHRKQKIGEARRRNAKSFTFSHREYGIFIGQIRQLNEAYPDQKLRKDELWKLTAGKYKSYKGWIVN